VSRVLIQDSGSRSPRMEMQNVDRISIEFSRSPLRC
jgi:hypothetical protein